MSCVQCTLCKRFMQSFASMECPCLNGKKSGILPARYRDMASRTCTLRHMWRPGDARLLRKEQLFAQQHDVQGSTAKVSPNGPWYSEEQQAVYWQQDQLSAAEDGFFLAQQGMFTATHRRLLVAARRWQQRSAARLQRHAVQKRCMLYAVGCHETAG